MKDGKVDDILRDVYVYIPEIGRSSEGRVYFATKIDTCNGRYELVVKIDSIRCITLRLLRLMPWTYRHFIKAAIKRIIYGEYTNWNANPNNNNSMMIRFRIPSCFQGILTLRKPNDTCFNLRPCPINNIPCCDVIYFVKRDETFPDSLIIEARQQVSVPPYEICDPYQPMPCGFGCEVLNQGERIRWIILQADEKTLREDYYFNLESKNWSLKIPSNVNFDELYVFDLLGNQVGKVVSNQIENSNKINVNLPRGLYIVRIVDKNGKVFIRKLLIN